MKRHLILILGLALLAGCTDKRPDEEDPAAELLQGPPVYVEQVADVQFQDPQGNISPIQAFQMVIRGGSLFITGRPFGFARWDISADPENPQSLLFAVSDNLMYDSELNPQGFSDFETFGTWIFDGLAVGALEVFANTAIMSGVTGTSVADIAETTVPREVRRYPNQSSDESGAILPADQRFIYKALVKHPTLPIIYGFRENDFLYTLNASLPVEGTDAIIRKTSYLSGQEVCCVRGATMFGGKLVVAMQSRLWILSLDSTGRVVGLQEIPDMQAVAVYATDNVLYVHHEPTSSNAGAAASGIYAFDLTGRIIRRLDVRPLSFAVHPFDTHLYANEDDNSVRIFRIHWNGK